MEITELDSAQGKHSFRVRGKKDMANFGYDGKIWSIACMHASSTRIEDICAHDLGTYHTNCTPEAIDGARRLASAATE